MVLILLSLSLELVFQSSCGACEAFDTLQAWQLALKNGALGLFGAGLLLLLWNLFTGINALFKEQPPSD